MNDYQFFRLNAEINSYFASFAYEIDYINSSSTKISNNILIISKTRINDYLSSLKDIIDILK